MEQIIKRQNRGKYCTRKKEGKYFVYKNKRITGIRKTIRKIRIIWRTKFIKCRTISYYYKKPEQKKKHQYN